MIRLSKEEMLHEWKRRRGMLPVTTSRMTMSRTDSSNIDEYLKAEIDDWYAHLLATEKPELLPTSDFSQSVTVTDHGDGSVGVLLPDECGRIVSVRMEGWQRSARILDDSDGAEARLQSCRYVSGKGMDPAGVMRGRYLTLYSKVTANATLTELICVAAPADGSYMFDRSALMTIDLK